MTGPRDVECPREDEAVAWALHALEPDEELQFERHLPGCPDCQAVVRDTEDVATALGTSVEQVDPPAALRESLLAHAARTPQRSTTAEPADEPAAPAAPRRSPASPPRGGGGSYPRGRRLLAAAAALVAVLAVGGLAARTAQLQQERDAAEAQVQRMSELFDELARPGSRHALLTTQDGTAVAAVLVADGRHEIVAMGMPPNPTDRSTYVLWGVAPGADPRPLGTFDITGADPGPRSLGPAGEADGYTAYAISLEQGRAAPAAPSAVMAQGPVEV